VVLALQRRFPEAIRLLKACLKWPAFLGDGPAAAHASLGQCYAALGRRDEALGEFEEAVRASPTWLPGLRAVGALYFERGRYEEAYRTFHRVLELAPGDADALRDVRRIEPFLRSVP
jgi:tetratricopeptide (TPR) repeat protein